MTTQRKGQMESKGLRFQGSGFSPRLFRGFFRRAIFAALAIGSCAAASIARGEGKKDPRVEHVVSRGLEWVANTQSRLGSWTADMFVKALKTGKHQGEGRPILPPMPWPNFAQLKEEDLRAIFAFLQTLPPIQNAVPDPVPPAAPPAAPPAK